jgi:hypothetical protein
MLETLEESCRQEKEERWKVSLEALAYHAAHPNAMLLNGWAIRWKVGPTGVLSAAPPNMYVLAAVCHAGEQWQRDQRDQCGGAAEQEAEDRGMQAAPLCSSENYTDASPRLLPAAQMASITS